jgi:hypothetical protein
MILGNVGIPGGVLSYTDGIVKTVTADSTGAYSIKVSLHWSGTITPAKSGYLFSPRNASFTDLTAAQTIQNFTAITAYTISGNVGVSGATLSYTDITPKTVLSNSLGNYLITVPLGWTGTVTPSKSGYLFSPASKPYTNIQGNQTLQNFTPYIFSDVPPTHPFWRYIEAFYKAGITIGCSQSPKMFCPDGLVTRGEMAVFIERAKGNFNPTPNPSGMFTDLPYLGMEAFTPFIEQLYNDGITTGCSSSPLKYCPQNNVNRAEMATFIERGIGHFNPNPNPSGMFSDVPAAGLEGLTKFIEQFYNDGITTGCGQNPLRFCPTDQVTRADMAVFIVRAFHIPLP